MRFSTNLAPALLIFAGLLSGCAGAGNTTDQGPTPGEWITLFDGSSVEGWAMTGPGGFTLRDDGTIVSYGGMGLYYYEGLMLDDFVLELDWKVESETANSGIFVRFPDAPDPWYAVNTGYEIQIDDNQQPTHQTGSIYSFSAPFKLNSKPNGEWNTYQIKVVGQRYQIYLNGEKVNDFYGDRSSAGMVGLQNHDDNSVVAFRNVRVMPLDLEEPAPQSLAEHFATDEPREPIDVLMVTTTHGFRHGPAIDEAKEVWADLSETTEFNFSFTEDIADLNSENLSNYDLLFFLNATMRLEKEAAAPVAAADPSAGEIFDLVLSVPQGDVSARLNVNLSGSPSGTITFVDAPAPAPLEDVEVDGDNLTFNFDAGQFGIIEGDLVMARPRISGTFSAGGFTIEAAGSQVQAPRIDPTPVTSSGPAGQWLISFDTPDGAVNVVLNVEGEPVDLSGTIREAGGAESAPLEEVMYDDGALSFKFMHPEFGEIMFAGDMQGDVYTGTLAVAGFEIPFTGGRDAMPAAALTEPGEPEILVSKAARLAVMDFLAKGKGIVGAHAALDAFYEWDEYREAVGGGLFDAHPWTQSVRVMVEEKDNPATAHLGDGFWIRDEIYVLDENPRFNSQVLMSLDMSSVEGEGDPRGMYRNDYPISWVREHNGGRVFITKLGHFPDVWTTPDFLEHVMQGMRMAAGRIESDFSGHFVKETIAEGVWPDDIAIDEQGNVWIAELTGKVFRYDSESGETTLVAEVPTTDPEKIEHGLYGIEVDPDFYAGDNYIYLFYAERESIINTLSRYRFTDGAIDLDSEEVLLRVPTEPQCCHQAGDIDWGADGTLYLSTGDTGMSETRPDWELTEEELEAFKERYDLLEFQWSRLVDSERSAQNLQDLRGKILRINKDGSIPKDNPFFGEPGVRWEVYAYGLRNPYRFQVNEETGHLYIGVVGPDAQFDYDEYNISTEGGENFGWPREIGRLMYNEWTPDKIPNYRPPIWEYTYESGGRSASGGPMYKHEGEGAFPPLFQNKVFVYDWARSWIKYGELVEGSVEMTKTNGESYTLKTQRLENVRTLDVLRGTRPISMELGPDGAIYVAEFTGFWGPAPGSKVTRYRYVRDKKKSKGETE